MSANETAPGVTAEDRVEEGSTTSNQAESTRVVPLRHGLVAVLHYGPPERRSARRAAVRKGQSIARYEAALARAHARSYRRRDGGAV